MVAAVDGLVTALHRQVNSLSNRLEEYEQRIIQLTSEVNILYSRIAEQTPEEYLTLQEAAEFVGRSVHTIKTYRKTREWMEGIHFIRRGTRGVLYRKEMLRIWVEYGKSDPDRYSQAIEVCLRSRDKLIKNLAKAK